MPAAFRQQEPFAPAVNRCSVGKNCSCAKQRSALLLHYGRGRIPIPNRIAVHHQLHAPILLTRTPDDAEHRATRSDSFLMLNELPQGDEVFVKELIRQKYVMVVHGSGFGQKPGTQHFRIVFLPDEKTGGVR